MMITHTLHTPPTTLTTTTHTMTTHHMTTPHTTTAITATTTIATITTPHTTTMTTLHTPATTTPPHTPTPAMITPHQTQNVSVMNLKEIGMEVLALITILILLSVETMTQTHSKPLCFAVFVVAVFTPLVKTMTTPRKLSSLLMKHALLLMVIMHT
jgi:hypothetical protein